MDKLDKLIETLTAILKSGKDLASSQLPDVVTQVIAREVTTNVYWLIVTLCFTIAAALLARRLYKKESVKQDAYHTPDPCWYLLPSIIGVFSFVVLLHNVDALIQVKIAPKAFAVDYLTKKISEIK